MPLTEAERADWEKRRRQDRIRQAAERIFGIVDELAIYRRNHLPSHKEPIYHQALRQRLADAFLEFGRAVAAGARPMPKRP